MTSHLARIDLYPIKSLDGLSVPTADILPSGALRHDRTFALFDQAGKFVNGKRSAAIHQVRSRFSSDCCSVTLGNATLDKGKTFHLTEEHAALEAWFSDYFQQPITFQQNQVMGFPDDTDSPGPTVISTATLQAIADWYGLSLAETRKRFRTNLEIDGVPAFWEDQLFSASGEPILFQIGGVTLHGINPCQRCVVPTRNPETGETLQGFQKQFIKQRNLTLPASVARNRFNHFYRLAVNTRIPKDSGKVLKVGESVSLGRDA
ncbi:MAG: MOSC N-terminal beta barrel domain-containing protein [Cyanobacteria bacterium P01_H01_bin.58]